jgi:hypothetical protein
MSWWYTLIGAIFYLWIAAENSKSDVMSTSTSVLTMKATTDAGNGKTLVPKRKP